MKMYNVCHWPLRIQGTLCSPSIHASITAFQVLIMVDNQRKLIQLGVVISLVSEEIYQSMWYQYHKPLQPTTTYCFKDIFWWAIKYLWWYKGGCGIWPLTFDTATFGGAKEGIWPSLLDGTLITGPIEADHLNSLQETLSCLGKVGLHLQLQKQTHTVYYRHIHRHAHIHAHITHTYI